MPSRIHDFDEAFTALCDTIEEQAQVDKSPIRFDESIARPFQSTSVPTSSSLLQRLATLFEEDGLLLRLDGAAVYLVVAIVLQFPPSSLLEKTIYFFMQTLEVYKDRKNAAAILRTIIKVKDIAHELESRCRFIFSPLLRRLRSILLEETKHDRVRRMAAQFIVALCAGNTPAWQKLIKNQKQEELFTTILRQPADYSLRILTSDIVRHLKSENYEIRKIWDITDDIAMDFPSSQELGSNDMAKLERLISSIDQKARPFKDRKDVYLLKQSSCRGVAMQFTPEQLLLVVEDSVKLFGPDRRKYGTVLIYYDFAINEHMTAIGFQSLREGVVRLKWSKSTGSCLFEGMKHTADSLDIEFCEISDAQAFLQSLDYAKKHAKADEGSQSATPGRQLHADLNRRLAIDIPEVSEAEEPLSGSKAQNTDAHKKPRTKQRQKKSQSLQSQAQNRDVSDTLIVQNDTETSEVVHLDRELHVSPGKTTNARGKKRTRAVIDNLDSNEEGIDGRSASLNGSSKRLRLDISESYPAKNSSSSRIDHLKAPERAASLASHTGEDAPRATVRVFPETESFTVALDETNDHDFALFTDTSKKRFQWREEPDSAHTGRQLSNEQSEEADIYAVPSSHYRDDNTSTEQTRKGDLQVSRSLNRLAIINRTPKRAETTTRGTGSSNELEMVLVDVPEETGLRRERSSDKRLKAQSVARSGKKNDTDCGAPPAEPMERNTVREPVSPSTDAPVQQIRGAGTKQKRDLPETVAKSQRNSSTSKKRKADKMAAREKTVAATRPRRRAIKKTNYAEVTTSEDESSEDGELEDISDDEVSEEPRRRSDIAPPRQKQKADKTRAGRDPGTKTLSVARSSENANHDTLIHEVSGNTEGTSCDVAPDHNAGHARIVVHSPEPENVQPQLNSTPPRDIQLQRNTADSKHDAGDASTRQQQQPHPSSESRADPSEHHGTTKLSTPRPSSPSKSNNKPTNISMLQPGSNSSSLARHRRTISSVLGQADFSDPFLQPLGPSNVVHFDIAGPVIRTTTRNHDSIHSPTKIARVEEHVPRTASPSEQSTSNPDVVNEESRKGVQATAGQHNTYVYENTTNAKVQSMVIEFENRGQLNHFSENAADKPIATNILRMAPSSMKHFRESGRSETEMQARTLKTPTENNPLPIAATRSTSPHHRISADAIEFDNANELDTSEHVSYSPRAHQQSADCLPATGLFEALPEMVGASPISPTRVANANLTARPELPIAAKTASPENVGGRHVTENAEDVDQMHHSLRQVPQVQLQRRTRLHSLFGKESEQLQRPEKSHQPGMRPPAKRPGNVPAPTILVSESTMPGPNINGWAHEMDENTDDTMLNIKRVRRVARSAEQPVTVAVSSTPLPFHKSMQSLSSPGVRSCARESTTTDAGSDTNVTSDTTLVDATTFLHEHPISLSPRRATRSSPSTQPASRRSEAVKVGNGQPATIIRGSDRGHYLQESVSGFMKDFVVVLEKEEQHLQNLIRAYHVGSQDLLVKFEHNATSRIKHDASKLHSKVESARSRMEAIVKMLGRNESNTDLDASYSEDQIATYGDVVLEMLGSNHEVQTSA